MSGPFDLSRLRRARLSALITGVSIITLGGAALAGWLFHIEALKSIIPGGALIKPNMAAGFALCGGVLTLLSGRTPSPLIRSCASGIAAVVIVLVALTLGEHFFGWNFPIEQWLIGSLPGPSGTSHPGRMAPVSALGFLLGGSALFAEAFFARKQSRLALVVGLSAALVFMGAMPLAAFLMEVLFGPQWNFMGMTISGVIGATGFLLLGAGLLALLQSEGELTWSLNASTTTGFVLALLLITVAAAAGFNFTRHMVETSTSVTHRQEVLKETEKLVSGLATLGSSERVYVIVGDEQLLKDRPTIQAELADDIRQLRVLTHADPNQQRRLDRLEPLISQRIDWEERVIIARREEGFATATKMIATEAGVELSDEIVREMNEMETAEYRLLDGDRKQADRAVSTAFALLPMGVFLSLAVLSLSAFFLNAGISERAKAEQSLRESEERFREVAENIDDIFWLTDLQHKKVLYISPAYERIWGRTRESLCASPRSWTEALHPEDRERILALRADDHLKATPEMTYRIVRPDGSLRWIHQREFPVKDADGKVVRVAGIVADITERKRVEEALRQAEEKYRGIFENAVEGIFQTTPDGRFIAANFALARLMGFESPEELIGGRTDVARDHYVDPASRAKFKQLLEENGSVLGFEVEVYRKDRSKIWFSENVRAVRDEKGTVVYYEGTAEDITKRKRAEDALRESERRFSDMLRNLELVSMMLDQKARVTYCNDYLLRLTGWRREEVIGRDWFELFIPPELVDELRGVQSALLADQSVAWHHENEILTRSGARRLIKWNNSVLRSPTGDVIGTASIGEDITEGKQAEAQRQRLADIVEASPDFIGFADPKTAQIQYINQHGRRMCGIGEDEDVGKLKISDVHPAWMNKRIAELILPAAVRDGLWQGDGAFLHRNGREIPVLMSLVARKAANGEVDIFFTVSRDITNRKRTENLLRASEERYRSLFESNPNPMWVYDIETLSFLAVNAAAVEHYGYSQDEFLAMTLKDIRPAEDIPALMADLAKQAGGAKGSTAWRHCRKNRTMIHVEVASRDLIWLGRRARLALVNDVTERKQAAERLQEQADLLNLAQDAIMVRGMDDRIAFWNRGAEHLYGWSAEEVRDQPSCDFIEYEEPLKILAERILLDTGAWSGECSHLTKQGNTVIVRSHWTLVRDEQGEPKAKLITMTDITEQKKLETHLMRAQRLESIGTLASGVAHDLNNILTPILMCAEILRENPDAEDAASSIDLIEESAKRGASVVKQVLTFARGIEGEHVVIKPTHLIQEMVDIAQKTFPKTIEIIGRYPEDLWSIKCDPTQLHQVLLNLSVNARDAMPNGGSLTLGAENFTVDENYAAMTAGAMVGSYVMLRVSDSGVGMPRATVDKIFDPFFTTKEIGKGTGLGLSTALGIVKSHNGFISVDSEPGKGTVFKIFLPATMSDVELQKSKTMGAPIQGNGEQILIVDDEPNILEITKRIFEKHNYRVITASDGTEALALFAQQMDSIGGVLTDIAMPYMNGVALARALRRMKSDIPIVASTGQGDQPGVAELRSLGVTNFLTKPYNTEKLLTTLKTAMERPSSS
jgi:PAS domain S-box-containing protein